MTTLEELEGDVWPNPAPGELITSLIRKCHRLRKKNIEAFEPEDVRVLVGQGIGLPHLAPLALAILEREPLEEGALGLPGALLVALVRQRNWPRIEGWSQRVEAVCQSALSRLDQNALDIEINGKRYPSPDRETAEVIANYLNRRSHKN